MAEEPKIVPIDPHDVLHSPQPNDDRVWCANCGSLVAVTGEDLPGGDREFKYVRGICIGCKRELRVMKYRREG